MLQIRNISLTLSFIRMWKNLAPYARSVILSYTHKNIISSFHEQHDETNVKGEIFSTYLARISTLKSMPIIFIIFDKNTTYKLYLNYYNSSEKYWVYSVMYAQHFRWADFDHFLHSVAIHLFTYVIYIGTCILWESFNFNNLRRRHAILVRLIYNH